jgi:DNA polymerase III delta prime subunit
MQTKLKIHENITEKLDYFLKQQKIPNIIFHGPSGSGKRTLVFDFVNKIYKNDKQLKRDYVLFVNCAHGKGIKFIRDELKFFAKTHINSEYGNMFKTVILSNADKLTIDAQSAIRRCIELFSHTTRFFIIIEDKYKLLKPILSRFSEIYIPYTKYNNLYQNNLNNNFNQKDITNAHIKKYLKDVKTTNELLEKVTFLYNKKVTALDLINYITDTYDDDKYKYELLLSIQLMKKELKCEKLIMLYILNNHFFRSDIDLNNILNM